MFPEVLRKTRSSTDYSELKNKPYNDFEINLDYLDTNKRQNTVMDLIQQNLLPDNDKFYAQCDPNTYTYIVNKDPDKAEKDKIVLETQASDAKSETSLSECDRREIKK